jgi:hypothetical protein
VHHCGGQLHRRQPLQPVHHLPEACRREAQPVHPGVELDLHLDRRAAVRGQQFELGIVVHDRRQTEARNQVEVARLEESLEQQDRLAPAGRTRALGFRQVKQRQAIGRGERRQHALESVAVRIGLDHRPHPPRPGLAARLREVVLQGIEMDQGLDRTRHVGRTLQTPNWRQPRS